MQWNERTILVAFACEPVRRSDQRGLDRVLVCYGCARRRVPSTIGKKCRGVKVGAGLCRRRRVQFPRGCYPPDGSGFLGIVPTATCSAGDGTGKGKKKHRHAVCGLGSREWARRPGIDGTSWLMGGLGGTILSKKPERKDSFDPESTQVDLLTE